MPKTNIRFSSPENPLYSANMLHPLSSIPTTPTPGHTSALPVVRDDLNLP